MEERPTSNSSLVLQNIIKALPALGIGAASICFILGLLIVNLYLGKYGIYSSEFARTDYILVGAIFISLIFIVGACFKIIDQQYKWVTDRWNNKQYVRAIVVAILALTLVMGALYMIFGLLIVTSKFASLKEVVIPISIVVFIFVCGYAFYSKVVSVIQIAKLSQQKEDKTLSNEVLDSLIIIPTLIFGIIMYATAVYPNISPAWGGGYKAPVMLVPTTRGLEVSKTLSLPIIHRQTMVGPIKVLTESEKELIILVPDSISGKELAIRLNRDMFDAAQTISLENK